MLGASSPNWGTCQKAQYSSKYSLAVRKMLEVTIRQNLPYCRFKFWVKSDFNLTGSA